VHLESSYYSNTVRQKPHKEREKKTTKEAILTIRNLPVGDGLGEERIPLVVGAENKY